MNQTEEYKLNLFEGEDPVSYKDINENTGKIEEALKQGAENLAAEIKTLTEKGELCHIATGSYTGTGKYGSANPNTLTFRFPPKLLFLFPSSAVTEANYNFDTVYGVGLAEAGRLFSIGSACTFSVSGNTASWYHEGGNGYQFNLPAKYCYVALG